MSNSTPQYIEHLLAARSRELQVAEPQTLLELPRELYNNKTIELQNNSSRVISEDDVCEEVSVRPAPCPEAVASEPVAETTSLTSLEETASQQAFGNDISAARTTCRYTGITIQHARTRKGIKLFISLQTADSAELGQIQKATAELKRPDRLREVRATEHDSVSFCDYLEQVKQDIREDERTICLGRIHERNKRSHWFVDTVAVAVMEDQRVHTVILYIEGEYYTVTMDQQPTARQQELYHSVGQWGTIRTIRRAPRIGDLPFVNFGS